MLVLIFTLDYEIHGNGEGCPYELMVEPTDRLLRLFDEYGAKLTIMADVAEILKFKEYKEQFGRDDYHYDRIVEQLRRAIQTGHDVQLHIHSSYFNAQFGEGRWSQDWSEYNFAGLPYERMAWMIGTGKKYLEELLRPVDAGYRCLAFRAANWSVSPSRNVIRSLLDHGIRIDTSVFKYGRRNGLAKFDYTHAHSALRPWRANLDDICQQDESSQLWEFPIHSDLRWIGAFLSANRIYRAVQTYRHRLVVPQTLPPNAVVGALSGPRGIRKRLERLVGRHAWKADFNQCSGKQLIRAVKRADREFGSAAIRLPLVLIGHSKLITHLNEWSLRPFLSFIGPGPESLSYGRFADFEPQMASFDRNDPSSEVVRVPSPNSVPSSR